MSGKYHSPLITPDGRWIFAVVAGYDKGQSGSPLVRYDLRTGQSSEIRLPRDGFYFPTAYIAPYRKLLITSRRASDAGSASDQGYLLDPETGAAQQVRGDFRPLYNPYSHLHQPTGAPYESWSAIYDSRRDLTIVGRYNTRAFVFTQVLELPGLQLTSSDIWADPESNKLWFTYQGHLLRLPLPAGRR
jgi:hypothetical protein